MRSPTTALVVSMVGAIAAYGVAAPPVEYTVSLDAPQTQMVDIAMRVRAVDAPILEVALPTWRPGRYRILDPAATVRAVRAFAGPGGRDLPIAKVDKSRWRIETQGENDVVVRYRVYANSIGDRTRHVDDTHAFLSGSAVFMYAPDHRGDAVRVHVEAPDDWRVATGLEPSPEDSRTFIASDYDVLVDSPFEIGRHDLLRFDVDDAPHEIVIWPTGVEYDAERLKEDFAKIVRAQTAIFGRRPYERYVFLVHAGGGGGGGTEHLTIDMGY